MHFIEHFIQERQNLIVSARHFMSLLGVSARDGAFTLKLNNNRVGMMELEESVCHYSEKVYASLLRGAAVTITLDYIPSISHFEIGKSETGRLYFTGKLDEKSIERLQQTLFKADNTRLGILKKLEDATHEKAIEGLKEKLAAAQGEFDYFNNIKAYLD